MEKQTQQFTVYADTKKELEKITKMTQNFLVENNVVYQFYLPFVSMIEDETTKKEK